MSRTHEVANQPPPLTGHDVYGTDRGLVEGVSRYGGEGPELSRLGGLAGSEQAQRWAVEANTVVPVLRTHDRYGNRLDVVDFHPSWHSLMQVAVEAGLAGAPWASTVDSAHVRRAAGFYVWTQVEAGHGCPISMTYSVVPSLRRTPELAAGYGAGLTSTAYDPGLRPPAAKAGLLAGMGMTEKQGGSDVRASTTRAVPGGAGSHLLTGHKWFCSAPMCDLFLVLAQAPGGLSCFVIPRVLPDGTRNTFLLQRLKDKLGNRSNASSEVEFDDTVGWLLGEEGRGVATIIEMVNMTRLDCVIGSAAAMRAALAQALHHATYRRAFGTRLVEAPAMANVLADLAMESEAATTLMLRLAAAQDGGESAFKRLALAVGKFWVCKRTPGLVAEAMECLGGNGYVEDSGLPRLYREAPLNSIWEGSGNVIALDVVRALTREPEAVAAFLDEVRLGGGVDHRLDATIKQLTDELQDRSDLQIRARRLTELMAVALQGSLLVRFAPAYVADAFCASRCHGDWGHVFGTLPSTVDTAAIVERARPAFG